MKRFFTLLLACLLLGALAAPALADVAYMPRDNFYEKHYQECSYLSRWYWTNGPEGYVLAHKTPGSAEATPLPNGGLYYISYLYNDRWGVVEFDKDTLEHRSSAGNASGWVDIYEMVADYDNEAFEADHRAELNSSAQAELKLEFDDVAYGYKYPGSGIVTKEFSGQTYWRDPFLLSPLFTDPAGRTWGYVGYNYGRHNCWICIDDPFNGALAPDENAVTFVAAAAPTTPEPPAPTEAPTPTAAPTQEPATAPDATSSATKDPDATSSATRDPDAASSATKDPDAASSATKAADSAEAARPDKPTAPEETPAPAGKTVELTPAADRETLDKAAKDNRGSGPYIAAGAAAVVIVAAAVLVATLKKKKK